jgi:hypothetical protein
MHRMCPEQKNGYSRQKNYIGGDDGDSFSERAIDVPYGSFRRSRRFDDVEMANLGRYDKKSNAQVSLVIRGRYVILNRES